MEMQSKTITTLRQRMLSEPRPGNILLDIQNILKDTHNEYMSALAEYRSAKAKHELLDFQNSSRTDDNMKDSILNECKSALNERRSALAECRKYEDLLAFQIRWCIDNNMTDLILDEVLRMASAENQDGILIELLSNIEKLAALREPGFVETPDGLREKTLPELKKELKSTSLIIKANSLYSAAINPNDRAIKFLIDCEQITANDMAQALCLVLREIDDNTRNSAIDLLLNKERMTPEAIAVVLSTAVRYQHNEEKDTHALDILMSRPELDDGAKELAILRISTISNESLRNACFNIILKHDGIENEIKQEAIKNIPNATIQAKAQEIFEGYKSKQGQEKNSTLMSNSTISGKEENLSFYRLRR